MEGDHEGGHAGFLEGLSGEIGGGFLGCERVGEVEGGGEEGESVCGREERGSSCGAEEAGLFILAGSPEEDDLLRGWWEELLREGGVSDLFGPGVRTYREFLREWDGSYAFYDRDEKGIWIVFWGKEGIWASTISCWVRRDRRGRRGIFRRLALAVESILLRSASVLALTSSGSVRDPLERLGFRFAGFLEGYLWGRTAFLLHMTREAFPSSALFRFRNPS